uniref:NAC domain-containing protein n=1 Tax=Nelumbo nucifera TaxID=4432 RepID=A0A822Z9V9_NELNU|nr:TPA_asm: hypothetical protein HUJ06_001303 [Nelumbo nucifera]DAD43074.1 TPA_asm: hypothetical protein HUJ06_001304 [Nelumbo nucifera]
MERITWVNDEVVELPVGFRFAPTDEELITAYLAEKIRDPTLRIHKITEVDIYQFDPEELIAKYRYTGEREGEWYFFTPRSRKYPNGSRPRRDTTNGHWKATGADKPIKDKDKNDIGVKKSLVFYSGSSSHKGSKTNWIMHEYRIAEHERAVNNEPDRLKFDDYVLCRIYKHSRGNGKGNDASPTVATDQSGEAGVEAEREGQERIQRQYEAENRKEEEDLYEALDKMLSDDYRRYSDLLESLELQSDCGPSEPRFSNLNSAHATFDMGNMIKPAPAMPRHNLPSMSNMLEPVIPVMPLQSFPPTNTLPNVEFTSEFGIPMQNVGEPVTPNTKKQRIL